MPTTEASAKSIEIKLTRYRIARIRTGQALLPFAMIGSIVARRSQEPAAIAIAVILSAATLVLLLSARKGYGMQAFSVRGGSITFGAQLTLSRQHVARWTLATNVARLYGAQMSWRLVCREDDRPQLSAQLTALLGRPIQLERRASKQARIGAVGAAAIGLACAVAAFIIEFIPLVVIGLPLFVIGLAAFGALSQRVARP